MMHQDLEEDVVSSEAMSAFVRNLIKVKTRSSQTNGDIWPEIADIFKKEFPGFKLVFTIWSNVTALFLRIVHC